MTREEATTKLKWFLESNLIEDISGCEGLKEAIGMAIEVISNTSKTLETLGCISRQAAIMLPVMPKEHRKYQTHNLDDAYEQGWFDLQECIERLPSAQPDVPDRKVGKWIEEVGMLMCSECGDAWGTEQFDEVMSFNFCPNCGARMEVEK